MPEPPGLANKVYSRIACSIWATTTFIFGVVYHNDCPKQPYIPFYLEVMGFYQLLFVNFYFLLDLINLKPLRLVLKSVSLLFLFCWFITGNVWIYSIYPLSSNTTITSVDPHCDRTLYLFAFWTTTMTYAAAGLFFVCGCCCFCFGLAKVTSDDDT